MLEATGRRHFFFPETKGTFDAAQGMAKAGESQAQDIYKGRVLPADKLQIVPGQPAGLSD